MFTLKKAKAVVFAAIFTMLVPYTAQAAAYKVVQGDTLYSLGKVFNTTSSAIMKDNGLSGTTIYPGQVLNVPGTTYTVQAGDTLYGIAKKFGVSVDTLKKASNEWDNIIYPGQKLIVPKVATGSTPSTGGSSTGARVPYTAADLDLLARLITAEAQGEPYNAQVAVGAVVINRVKDSRYPNTIKGVIYEVSGGYYQFSPVLNGYINKPATEESKKAAYDALHGADPSRGAFYYFDDSATNKWLWSKPLAARIGHMVFVY